MTPEWKLLINFCLNSQFRRQFNLNLVKIDRCEVAENRLVLLTKKTQASGTRPSHPFRPRLTDCAQNFVNVVGP